MPFSNDKTYFVDVNLGNECNFRCKYCCEDVMEKRVGSISFEVLDKTFIFIDKVLQKTNKDIVINLWGGEPLLHYDKLKKILEYYKNHKRVRMMIYTNGFFIEKYIDDMKQYKNNTSIQVSYDFEPCNTLNRTYDKKISDKIRNSILLLKKEGFRCWTKSTIRVQDLENHLFDIWYDLYNFNKENNLNLYLAVTLATSMNYGKILNFNAIEEQLKKLVTYFYKNNISKTNFNWFDDFCRAECHTPKIGCLVDIDGRVYPCHGCSMMDDEHKKIFAYLDVNDIENDEKFVEKFIEHMNNFKLISPEECKECKNIVCFRCNAHNTMTTSYDLDGWNSKNCDILCKLYTLISKYAYVYHNLLDIKGNK